MDGQGLCERKEALVIYQTYGKEQLRLQTAGTKCDLRGIREMPKYKRGIRRESKCEGDIRIGSEMERPYYGTFRPLHVVSIAKLGYISNDS